eukprot:m.113927 g.113927  ORF g.113927 m.113927 type:complete len:140 (+) comp15361_c0_seq14:8249-8668(+)
MLLALLIAKAFAQGVSCQRIPEQLEMLLCRRHATPRTRRWYLSVPWSPSRVSTAPAYPIDEPVITAATTWDFSITSNILRLDYVVRHTNSSELDAAALRLYPNITGKGSRELAQYVCTGVSMFVGLHYCCMVVWFLWSV